MTVKEKAAMENLVQQKQLLEGQVNRLEHELTTRTLCEQCSSTVHMPKPSVIPANMVPTFLPNQDTTASMLYSVDKNKSCNGGWAKNGLVSPVAGSLGNGNYVLTSPVLEGPMSPALFTGFASWTRKTGATSTSTFPEFTETVSSKLSSRTPSVTSSLPNIPLALSLLSQTAGDNDNGDDNNDVDELHNDASGPPSALAKPPPPHHHHHHHLQPPTSDPAEPQDIVAHYTEMFRKTQEELLKLTKRKNHVAHRRSMVRENAAVLRQKQESQQLLQRDLTSQKTELDRIRADFEEEKLRHQQIVKQQETERESLENLRGTLDDRQRELDEKETVLAEKESEKESELKNMAKSNCSKGSDHNATANATNENQSNAMSFQSSTVDMRELLRALHDKDIEQLVLMMMDMEEKLQVRETKVAERESECESRLSENEVGNNMDNSEPNGATGNTNGGKCEVGVKDTEINGSGSNGTNGEETEPLANGIHNSCDKGLQTAHNQRMIDSPVVQVRETDDAVVIDISNPIAEVKGQGLMENGHEQKADYSNENGVDVKQNEMLHESSTEKDLKAKISEMERKIAEQDKEIQRLKQSVTIPATCDDKTPCDNDTKTGKNSAHSMPKSIPKVQKVTDGVDSPEDRSNLIDCVPVPSKTEGKLAARENTLAEKETKLKETEAKLQEQEIALKEKETRFNARVHNATDDDKAIDGTRPKKNKKKSVRWAIGTKSQTEDDGRRRYIPMAKKTAVTSSTVALVVPTSEELMAKHGGDVAKAWEDVRKQRTVIEQQATMMKRDRDELAVTMEDVIKARYLMEQEKQHLQKERDELEEEWGELTREREKMEKEKQFLMNWSLDLRRRDAEVEQRGGGGGGRGRPGTGGRYVSRSSALVPVSGSQALAIQSREDQMKMVPMKNQEYELQQLRLRAIHRTIQQERKQLDLERQELEERETTQQKMLVDNSLKEEMRETIINNVHVIKSLMLELSKMKNAAVLPK